MKTNESRIYLLSDTHLIANNLHDDEIAFQKMRDTSAGKDLDYQEIMLSAFVRKIVQDKPDAVVITGDLTFNGEKISAQRLAEIFKPLVQNNIAFYAVAGNHDINDGWARKFEGDFQYRTSQIGPQDWKEIFVCSYQNASSVDTSSLSYSVVFNKKYRLIFADSNIYSHNEALNTPITQGKFSTSQLNWIEDELAHAKQNHQYVLFFMHHNLYDHNNVIHGGFTLNNTDELKRLFAKYNTKAVFSGHIHAQNISLPQNNCPAFDIASSCFCMCDQGYGIITLNKNKLQYNRKSFNYKKYITTDEARILPINFHQYLKLRFFKTNEMQMRRFKTAFNNEQDYWDVINLTNKLNWNFFIGKSFYSAEKRLRIINSKSYHLLTQLLPEFKPYVDSLISIQNNSQNIECKL